MTSINLALAAYPVGSIYMSVNSTSPATIFGGTWERITGKFLLSATDNGSSGASQAAGNTGGEATHKLTASESGVSAHKHTVPQHGHGDDISFSVNNSGYVANGVPSAGSHSHVLFNNGNGNSETDSWKVGRYSTNSDLRYSFRTNSGAANWGRSGDAGGHTHNLPNHTHTLSKSGGVSDRAAFDTNNNSAADASSAHNNMPPYLSVYMWKRTA